MGDFLDSSVGKESACNAEDPGLIPGSGRSTGEGIGYHSSVLAWRIPWTVLSMGCKQLDMTERLSDLESTLLSEICQTEKDKYWVILLKNTIN